MKTNLKLTIILMFLLCGISYGQAITEPYKYPMRPGMEGWRNVAPKDRVKTLTVPPALVKSMTTSALAKTCLDFPLFNEILTANNLQQGFDALTNLNGIFQELLTRKDAGEVLLQLYTRMDPGEVKKETSLNKQGHMAFQFTYIELWLAQDKILSTLTSAQRTALRKAATVKFETKKELPNIFGGLGLNTTGRVLLKILKADGRQRLINKAASQSEIDALAAFSIDTNKALLNSIYDASKSY